MREAEADMIDHHWMVMEEIAKEYEEAYGDHYHWPEDDWYDDWWREEQLIMEREEAREDIGYGSYYDIEYELEYRRRY
jgi:hypothetical protein